jgi:hypothetical protein
MIVSEHGTTTALRRMGIGCLCAAIAVLVAAMTAPNSAMAAPVQVLTHPAVLPPASERFREGVAAYDKGDFTQAFKIWLPLAQQADLAAMRNVALLLRTGKGVERDPARALWFYEEAGSKGFALAQVNAAFMHLEGDGVPKNLEAAAFWFHEAARAGSPIAQYNLAVMYERGTGVDKDMAKALGWYALAARSGSELAIKRLEILVPALSGPKAPEHSPMSPKEAGTPVAISAQSPRQMPLPAPAAAIQSPADALPPSFRKVDTGTPDRD